MRRIKRRGLLVAGIASSLIVSAGSAALAQFPLPIPKRPSAFPLQFLTNQGSVIAWGLTNDGRTFVPASLTNAVQVTAGAYHTVALKRDGTVVAWGYNGNSQTSVPSDLTNAVRIATGANGNHNVALRNVGTVVAWGSNAFGQIFVPAGLSNVVQVAAGGNHTVVLKSDGTVVAWGSNTNGQTSVPAGLTNVVQVAAGGSHTVTLKSDGTVVAWGNNTNGQTSVPAGLTNVVQITAGGNHTAALLNNGTVVAWGYNYYGQTSVPSGLTNVLQIAAGGNHTVALKSDGTVAAWGNNAYSQASVPVGLANAMQIAAGGNHTAVVVPPLSPIEAWRQQWFGTTLDSGNAADSADPDADGLLNASEFLAGTSPTISDTDGDGLSDSLEVNTYKTDPLKADTDGDGLSDGVEVNTWKTDPLKADTDGDGFSDGAETQPRYGLISGGPWTWAQAKVDAIARGGRLAVFPTYESWRSFYATRPSGATGGWIGLTDEVVEGQWKWVDGSSLSYSGAWYTGAPDNSGDEDYAQWWTLGIGTWNDIKGETALPAYTIENFAGGCNPLSADTDGDGLNDGVEVTTYKTDPLKADTDGDGLSDGAEVGTYSTNPLILDTDGDRLIDGAEVDTYKTDPLKADTDGDGLNDGAEIMSYGIITGGPWTWEQAKADATARGGRLAVFPTLQSWQNFYALVPSGTTAGWIGLTDEATEGQWVWVDGTSLTYSAAWSSGEPNDSGGEDYVHWRGDGKWNDGKISGTLSTYAIEYTFNSSNPLAADTDGDGLNDGTEVNTYKTDPCRADTDSDGLTDTAEISIYGTNPTQSDTDGDGLNDGAEVNTYKTDPLKADTDGDGLSDGGEVNNYKTDLLKIDTDGDGISDGAEVNTYKTDPLKTDSDGDGLSDPAEINVYGTNPTKADSDGDGLSDSDEINIFGTSPTNADTDGDGFSDSHEILNLKTNPLGPNNEPSFTTVTNARNPDEDNAGYDVENAGIGYVGQDYEISITEVTNLMYARFLNAVAKSDSLYGLYTTLMGSDAKGGIVRSGSSGNYTYAVKSGFENKPVNFVSLFDTLRYINWLHNGMPTTQVQDETTTENGAYKLLGSNPRQVVRNFAAKYFLPDQDEWHKAAFFNPAPGGGRPSDSYWPYADQTTTGPGGNFGTDRTAVVSTSAGASHYGTYDQGGNLWEWTETVLPDERRLISQGNRPMSPALVTQETADLGFRVGKPVLRSQVSPLVIPAIVPVGEAYNLGDDMANNRGGVAYDFQMGTYEVTNEEYAAFLNAVAKTDSFYGLYNTQMGSNAQGGITRSGSNGSYVYTVKSGFAKKPVNFVTAYNAMRFCNWLHNGAQPDGDTESGAYRLLGNIPSNTTVLRRNAGARYYLPTEDEWYKAAFYDSSIAAMLTGNYWAYAVKSDTASGSTINFASAFGGLTEVTTPGYPSYFGTYGQSGNAAEWTETLSGSYRVVRGGHYASAAASVSYTGFITSDPSAVAANVGFRIAAARAIQNIAAFAPIAAKTFGDAPFSITLPAASSGLPVAVSVKSGPATISGNTVTITGAGTVVLAANQPGDWDYDAAAETTVSFIVGKRSQTIGSFPAIPTQTFGSAPFGINAPAASSGLPVTLSVKSGPATISSNVVTLTNVGTVVLAANQSGNENFSQAPEVTTSFSVVSFDSEFQSWLGRYPSMNAQKKGVSDDADGDGMPNLAEFAMDRDPSSAPSTERIVPVISGNELRLIFNRRKDHAALGLQIFAETSTSLDVAGWTKTGVVEQVISNSITTETIQAAVPIASGAKKFLRVRVVK